MVIRFALNDRLRGLFKRTGHSFVFAYAIVLRAAEIDCDMSECPGSYHYAYCTDDVREVLRTYRGVR